MATIRRLYLYGVLLVSLLAIIWGVIGVLNTLLSSELDETGALAGSLSIALVAAPIFGLHWWLARRGVRRDTEEAQARLRAVFLYGVLLATLIPALHNGMLLVERFFLLLFRLPSFRTILFGEETWVGGSIAIVINLLAAGYFFLVLRQAWQEIPDSVEEFYETRRLYRYIWLFYSLILTVIGIQNLIKFLLSLLGGFSRADLSEAAVGLALLAGGAPLWYFWNQQIRASLNQLRERYSILRAAALYLLVFAGAIGLLFWAVEALREIFITLLEDPANFAQIFSNSSFPSLLAVLIAFTPFWVYYQRMLKNTIAVQGNPPVVRSANDATVPVRRSTYLPRQAALLRIYTYFMAFLGLLASTLGLINLLAALVDLLFSRGQAGRSLLERLGSGPVSPWLSSGLAMLIVGVPLWWFFWRPHTREARLEGEAGDHTRRSLVRRVYLYLVLFAGVIVSMFAAGRILYLLIQAVLGQSAPDPLADTMQALRLLLVFGALGVYHGLWLRSDLRLAGNVLVRRHAQYPVLVLTPEPPPSPPGAEAAPPNGGFHTAFGEAVVAALQSRAPALPVAVHPAQHGAPDETLSAARAVIVPSGLLAKPPEGLRLWLQGFNGARIVIPTPAVDWYWTNRGARSLGEQARQAASIVGRLAEGEDVSGEGGSPAWQPLVYVLAALFVLQIIFILITSVISLLVQ